MGRGAAAQAPRQTTNRSGIADAGFDSASPSGTFAPRAHNVVKQKTREHIASSGDPHRTYAELAQTIRVGLRAEKGPLKGKPFLGVVDGEQFPDEVDSRDRATWLQPGSYMDIPKQAAYHLFGNVWDPDLPDRRDVINRYGGPQYAPPPGGTVAGRGAPMVIKDFPKIPDVLLVEVDRRGRVRTETCVTCHGDGEETITVDGNSETAKCKACSGQGEVPAWKSVFELYTRGMKIGGRDSEGGDADSDDD
jgi:hypothetical protein